jgi:hypothetical protein
MQDPAITASPAKKPSGRQMFRIAYQLLEVAGIPAPETSADAELERQHAHERRKPRSTGRNGRRLETEPFCGDCHAVRPATSSSCPACGSTQPPNLSRMDPRAAHQIGQGALH